MQTSDAGAATLHLEPKALSYESQPPPTLRKLPDTKEAWSQAGGHHTGFVNFSQFAHLAEAILPDLQGCCIGSYRGLQGIRKVF